VRDPEYQDVSAGSIAASIGTVILTAAAITALWSVGVVLAIVSLNQPGMLTVAALAYAALGGVMPLVIARSLRRSGATWRSAFAAWSATVVGISALFFPVAASAWGLF
jgi:hypothetical protein